ncbi:MAG: lamin tail domain-containing protein [Pedosphaera sp.]|nr:lamin tail domain-containing protein [Pedosphaera sp.]
MTVPATGATSFGRSPDGGGDFRTLAALTPGTVNASRIVPTVVLNELFYHSISENDDEQFVELYNPGSSGMSLRNWQLSGGVDFNFASTHSVPAGGYLVVARNKEKFLALHTNLTATQVVGNFEGRLSHAGERVQLKDASGVVVENVTYGTDGR